MSTEENVHFCFSFTLYVLYLCSVICKMLLYCPEHGNYSEKIGEYIQSHQPLMKKVKSLCLTN
jgi:hypothetical protein